MLDKNDKEWIDEAIDRNVRSILDEVVMPGFGMIDASITSLEGKFDSLEKRVGSLENKVDSLEETVGSLETKIDSVDRKLMRITDHHGVMLDNHQKRIIKIERMSVNV